MTSYNLGFLLCASLVDGQLSIRLCSILLLSECMLDTRAADCGAGFWPLASAHSYPGVGDAAWPIEARARAKLNGPSLWFGRVSPRHQMKGTQSESLIYCVSGWCDCCWCWLRRYLWPWLSNSGTSHLQSVCLADPGSRHQHHHQWCMTLPPACCGSRAQFSVQRLRPAPGRRPGPRAWASPPPEAGAGALVRRPGRLPGTDNQDQAHH